MGCHSIGACAYVLVGRAFIGDGNPDALARILQGLLAGIGFVGGMVKPAVDCDSE